MDSTRQCERLSNEEHVDDTISCTIADQVAHQMIRSYWKQLEVGLQTNTQTPNIEAVPWRPRTEYIV